MTKKLKGYGTFDVVLIVILVIVSFACVYPFWYVFANSFASYNVASRGAVAWWPSELSLDGYHAVFENKYLVSGFTVTVLRTIVATSAHVLFTSFVSYDVTVPMGRGFSHADGWADAPPISLLSCQKRNGPCTVQREKRWRAPVQWPSARRGAADRCKRRFGPAFGHAILFCDFSNCRPVADRAEVVGVVIAWSCFSFRCR